jgi:hypothetical protein
MPSREMDVPCGDKTALLMRAQSAEAQLAEARKALDELLEDTQHLKHHCPPGKYCPVENARKVLALAPSAEADLKKFGYAPGDYSITCHICGCSTRGGHDKHAITCKRCAQHCAKKEKKPA